MNVQTRRAQTRSSATNVAVVGASLAGLEVARMLAEKGAAVAVYERATLIGRATRTLIVTPRLRDTCELEIGEGVTNEIHRYELFANGDRAEIALSEPDLVIERAALMETLAQIGRASCRER